MSDGRKGHRYRQLRENQRAKGLPCYRCRQPIDYQAKWPDPESFSYDHDQPLSKHPELAWDPGNGRSLHLRCNQSKGDRDTTLGLGNRSEDF